MSGADPNSANDLGYYLEVERRLMVYRLINDDCLSAMADLASGDADIVVTSPPYNLGNSSGGGFRGNNSSGKWKNAKLRDGYVLHKDNMPHDEYVSWQRACLSEMMRIIPDHGAIFYNHKCRVQRGLLQDRSDILEGFPVRQQIIWKRAGGLNFNEGYFVPTYEIIYLIAKPKFKLRKGASALGDVWVFTQERNNDHPAPFPLDLPLRCIGSSAEVLCVLDPFAGSGTTCVAAEELSVNSIGIEKSAEYILMAKNRIESHARGRALSRIPDELLNCDDRLRKCGQALLSDVLE